MTKKKDKMILMMLHLWDPREVTSPAIPITLLTQLVLAIQPIQPTLVQAIEVNSIYLHQGPSSRHWITTPHCKPDRILSAIVRISWILTATLI